MLAPIATVLSIAIGLFTIFMWARLILEYARFFAPKWRPRGVMLVIAETVFTVTDPPLKLVRRVVPPLRVGNVAIDLAWIIVMFALIILSNLVQLIR